MFSDAGIASAAVSYVVTDPGTLGGSDSWSHVILPRFCSLHPSFSSRPA